LGPWPPWPAGARNAWGQKKEKHACPPRRTPFRPRLVPTPPGNEASLFLLVPWRAGGAVERGRKACGGSDGRGGE